MSILTIKLFNKISIPASDHGATVLAPKIAALNTEVALFGYTLTPALLTAMASLNDDQFNDTRDSLIANLAEVKGANKSYIRLFNKFPYDAPDQHDYMEKRVLAKIAAEYNIPLGGNRLTPLSCGHIIDSALFDIDDFGACPICQHSVPELDSADIAVYDFKSVTPLTALYVSRDGFRTEGNRLLARNSSLSQDEKTFLNGLVEQGISLDFPPSMFKETLPFAFKLFGADAIAGSISGATDVMRIAYFISDENSDLSLKENVKFRLSTGEKREILTLLDGQTNLAEDMMRHRERWIRLAERLAPGSKKNRIRFPNVAVAFDRLRNDPKSIVTFNKQVEEHIRSHAVNQSMIDLLTTRPGEYARKIDFMLREAADPSIVVGGLTKVAPKLPERLMLDLRKYLGSRNDQVQRLFIPKGAMNKLQVMDDKRKPLPIKETIEAILVLDEELQQRYSDKESLGKVYIDPALKDILLPFNRRGDSSTSNSEVQKGSRYPVDGEFVRLFVWWQNGPHNRVDVDLSMVFMDESFNQAGHIGYTNLSNDSSQHSGDIQNAPTPKGASEFIDINIEKMLKAGHRYVAASVLSFTGESFDTFPCFAGFMERDKLKSGKIFEPASVRFRYELESKTTRTIPLIFDLKERKVIFADIMAGGGRYGSVMHQSDKHKAMTQAVLSYPECKPTLYDVAFLNAKARGEIVETPEEAETIYDLSSTNNLMAEAGAA